MIIDGDESIRNSNSDDAVMLAAEQFSEEETETTTLTEEYDHLQLSSLLALENNQNEDDSQTLQSKSPDDDEDESDLSATDDVSYDDEPYPQSPEFDGEFSPKELTIASNHDESSEESSRLLLRRERSSNKKNKKKQQKLNIAVLRVSYTVGYELLDLILHDSMNIQKAGGSKIILDSEEPSIDTTIILLWMLAAFSISASACCCLLLCVNRGFILDEPAPQPQRPVRRRLTVDQVVEKYPLFHYHHRHEHGDEAGGDLLEECAICLDDLAEGIPCRQLPCQHVFHGRCIAKWLIERSATCPLCKIDLYEEEKEEEETESDSPGGDEDQVNFFHWMMETLLRSESGEGGEGNVEASPSTTAATNANPPANNLPSEETPPQPETPLTSSTWSSFNRWRRRLFRREVSAVNDLTEPLLQEGVSSQSPRRRDQDERETSGETHQDESLERPSQEQEVRDERNASPEELEASTGHDDHGPQEV